MRRGTVREMLLCYKEALQGLQNLNPHYLKNMKTGQYIESHYFSILNCVDFRYALALEPQNKSARAAEKRIDMLLK